MKNLLLLCALIILGIHLPSCHKVEGSGPIIMQTVTLPAFNAIKSNIAADIYVTKGLTQKIEIEGQQNLIDELALNVENGILSIKNKEKVKIVNWKTLKIHLTIPEWLSVELKGSGNIEGISDFESSNFYAHIGGSGNILLYSINSETVNYDISGSGDIKTNQLKAINFNTQISGSGTNTIIDGAVDNHTLKINGSGSFDFTNKFIADSAHVSITGSGNANLHVISYLNAQISGSGNIIYYGQPKIDVNITGSGKIKNGQ